MRRHVLLALVAALVSPPAHAVEVVRGDSHVTPHFHDDGGACFEIVMGGPITGAVAAAGLVSTKPSLGHVQQATIGRPTDLVSGVLPVATSHDSAYPCLGGVGRPVLSGWVVFTVTAHAQRTDYVAVWRCTYSGGPPSCV